MNPDPVILQRLVNNAECSSFHETSPRKDIAEEIAQHLFFDIYLLIEDTRCDWNRHVGTN